MTLADNRQLKLAIIGHTNAGKTSLLRTLIRDREFGDVSAHAATTRHVEAVDLELGQGLRLEFLDTPGFEDPVGLINILHSQQPDPRMTGPIRLNHFLNSEPARSDFAQEAKAIRQFMLCDLLLYVADATEPVSARYSDEFLLLNWSGKPCLVVLNFVASTNRGEEWRTALRNAGLHNVVEFDTVVFNTADEQRLLKQLALLLPEAEPHLQQLQELRLQERREQLQSASVLIVEALMEAAAVHGAEEFIKDQARQTEQRLNRDLLGLFRFTESDYSPDDLPINGSQWEIDLFDPEVLSSLGLSLGSSAAKGAAAGATIDLLTGFTSLGMAALIGGVIGTGIDSANRFKQYISREQDEADVTEVADHSLAFMARRACMLVHDLARRGHAAMVPLESGRELATELDHETKIASILSGCRHQPDWVSSRDDTRFSRARRELIPLIRTNMPADP